MRTRGERSFEIGPTILAAAVLAPLVYAWFSGAASIPHNDDWAFLRILFHLSRHGELQLVGWNEMVLVGHLLWAYPLVAVFGEHIALLDSVVALTSALGVVLAIRLARRFVRPTLALSAGVLLAIFPGHAQTSVSYMTDPVAFLAQLGCVLTGLTAIERGGREGRSLLLVSLGIGLFGFSIREFAVVAPMAVAAGFLAAERKRGGIHWTTIAGAAATLVTAAVIYLLRQQIPDGGSHIFEAPGVVRLVVLIAQSLFTVGLGLSPVLIALASTRRDALLRCLNLGALVALALAVVALQNSADISTCCHGERGSVFVGNALTERGMLGNQVLPGERPILIPYPYWILLTAAGIAGGTLAAGWLWSSAGRWFRDEHPVDPMELTLIAWGGLTAIGILTRAALGGPLFDRYLTAVLLVGLIFALRALPDGQRLWGTPASIAVTTLIAVTTASLVISGLAYDLARWRAGRAAVQEGVPPKAIDAGFEWVGFHYRGVTEEELAPVTERIGPGYFDKFPAAANCVVVSDSLLDHGGLSLVRTMPYRVWFGLKEFELFVYRHPVACTARGIV